MPDRTTLVIAPEGGWSSSTAPTRPAARWFARMGRPVRGEVQLRDLLRAHGRGEGRQAHRARAAAHVDRMAFSGYASTREVAPAIAGGCARPASRWSRSARTSTRASTSRAGAQASEVYLDPMGGMLLEGLAATASTTAKACRTSSAWTCTCSRSANTSPRPNPTSSTRPRRSEGGRPVLDERRVAALPPTSPRRARSTPRNRRRHRRPAAEGIEAAQGDLGAYAKSHHLVDG